MTDEASDEGHDRLIAGLRNGEPGALEDFVSQYQPALERVAARNIANAMRRRFGPESVAQSVCRTFLRRAQAGELEVADAERLWSLLCAIALTKVREKVRFHGREKRDVRREIHIDAAEGGTHDLAQDPGPTPDENALFADTLDHVLSLCSAEERRILVLRLEGREVREIAEHLGVSGRTVFRMLARVEDRLSGLFSA